MKNKVLMLLFLVLSFTVFAQETIGVTPVTIYSKDGEYDYLQDAITDSVINSFLQQDYSLVERSRIDAAINELKFQMSGLADEEASKVGSMVGADYVALTSLTQIGLRFTMNIRLVNSETGAVLKIGSETGGLDDLLDLSDLILNQSNIGISKAPTSYAVISIWKGTGVSIEQSFDFELSINGIRIEPLEDLNINKNQLENYLNNNMEFFWIDDYTRGARPIVELLLFYPIESNAYSLIIDVVARYANKLNVQDVIPGKPYFYYVHREKIIDGNSQTQIVTRARPFDPPNITNWNKDPINSTLDYYERKYNIKNIPYIVLPPSVID